MRDKDFDQSRDGDPPAFGRGFKYALIAYAVVEFIVLAFVVYHKAAR